MKYEIRIYAKDQTKVIRFVQEGGTHQTPPPAWDEFVYALGAVIDDRPEQVLQPDGLIATLKVPQVSFDEVVDVMCEDLSQEMTQLLTAPQEVSEVVLALV
ncbi:hypothetical protein [Eisenibacter elegans]|jgi:hypothetical protein|uniref:hypothetical protein n=1 Tax=Eisenibacter elegans TaxID=997 RepID=UPI0004273618|nr:hypothetical protein [Eisenibacter elegans]